MAEQENQQDVPKSSGKARKILLVLLIILILGAAGAAAYLMLWKDKGDQASDAEAKAEPIEIADPIFVKVGPMTINLRGRLSNRLLYTSMMIKVGDETTESFLNTQMPDINNRMLILLSQQTAEELNAAGGKELVAQRILEALERPFADPQPELAIESVLFQDFIVQ